MGFLGDVYGCFFVGGDNPIKSKTLIQRLSGHFILGEVGFTDDMYGCFVCRTVMSE